MEKRDERHNIPLENRVYTHDNAGTHSVEGSPATMSLSLRPVIGFTWSPGQGYQAKAV